MTPEAINEAIVALNQPEASTDAPAPTPPSVPVPTTWDEELQRAREERAHDLANGLIDAEYTIQEPGKPDVTVEG
jgi:hypothetical protein